MLRPHALLAAAMLIAGSGLHAQVRSSLVLLATAGDYPGETYTDGPLAPAEFVFVEGESVAVDVSVANWGARLSTVDLSQVRAPVVEAVGGAEQRLVHASLLKGIWRDGIGGSEAATAAAAISIEPGDALRWRLMFDGAALAPGLYRVSAQFDATDEAGEAVRRQRPAFTIEVRARSAVLPAELARRTAEWLTAQGQLPQAHAATVELERVYPDSVAVHLIRSRLAEAQGNAALARRELDVAAGFMRMDRDVLFRRFARPGQIEDLIDSIAP